MVAIKTSPRLVELLARVYQGQVEITLLELCDILGLPETELILERIQLVEQFCEESGFALLPAVGERGDPNTPRLLRLQQNNQTTADAVRQELQRGESERLEFKGSLLYDISRARHDPRATLESLRSEEVLHSALKTIAAFLTCQGGILYLGVDDKGRCTGLDCDFALLPDGKKNPDGWQLSARDLIKGRFHEGSVINDYVRVNFVPIDGQQIVRAEIAPRRRLSFLRYKSVCKLFRRQGNRTAEVPYEEIEEFMTSRSKGNT